MAATNVEMEIYDISLPVVVSSASLCTSCKYKGKSFVCLIPTKSKTGNYPNVTECLDYKKMEHPFE